MTMTTGDWTPPTREEILRTVRRIIEENPQRHRQHEWIGNRFTLGGCACGTAGEAARYALLPLPLAPEDTLTPVCGTTGCLAGWAAILAAPPGTKLDGNGSLSFPPGYDHYWEDDHASTYTQKVLRLDNRQAAWLFAGHRSREEILNGIDLLLEDEYVTLWPR
jgi:hypothetical protein